MGFHLFVSSVIFLMIVVWFSEHSSFTSFVRLFPRYFILFDAIVNGIVFLTSLSVSSSLVYRNPTDFCVLIFYSATLPKSDIRSSRFGVYSLGFLYTIIVSSAKRDRLTYSLQTGMPFITLRCLIVVASTSQNMLNKNEQSGYSCLVSVHKGKAFSFSRLIIMLAVCLSYLAFIMLRYLTSIAIL